MLPGRRRAVTFRFLLFMIISFNDYLQNAKMPAVSNLRNGHFSCFHADSLRSAHFLMSFKTPKVVCPTAIL